MQNIASKANGQSWSSMSESALIRNFPLHRACRDGDVAQLINLLQQKDSASAHMCLEDTYYGWTPLHWASYFGKLDCLRVLVEASNASIVNLKTSRFNQTPVHIAAFAGHPHCLQWLIKSGADVNVRDYLAETPLHKAARTGSEECVSILVNSKALTGVKNDSDKTPAELAHLCRHTSVANFLLSLPKQESSVRSMISSNGYYGYQPINGSAFKKVNLDQDPSMEMDTEDAAIATQVNGMNGFHSSPMNGHRIPNGVLSSPSDPKVVDHFTNGAAALRNGLEGDITLSEEVSLNRLPIAGKKRSREETLFVQQTKRIRTEELSATPLALKNPLSCNAHPTERLIENDSPSASLTTLNSLKPPFPCLPLLSKEQLVIPSSGVSTAIMEHECPSPASQTRSKQTGDGEEEAMITSTNVNCGKVGGSGHYLTNPIPITASSGPVTVNNNKAFGEEPSCPVGGCSMKEHFDSVVVERGYDALNFHMMMADVHGC